MTDTGSSRTDLDGTPRPYSTGSGRTAWTGWIMFAALMLLLNGCIQMLEGLMGLVNEDYYTAATEDLTVSLSYGVWGWAHLILGVALFAAGLGIMSGNRAARMVGVGLAGINALVALAFLDAAPGWGIVVITVDVVIIYALTVHGHEMSDNPI
jgi:hypothetical protein